MAKIEDFFTLTNSVEGIDDEQYHHLDPMIRAIDAMANATYQSIYVIDYLKHGFLHVASNPLFLCGHTAEEVRQMGYRLYIDHVPAKEQIMLTEINEVGFKRFNEEPIAERSRCFMSYDFHIVNGEDCYLVNHKITPFVLLGEPQDYTVCTCTRRTCLVGDVRRVIVASHHFRPRRVP